MYRYSLNFYKIITRYLGVWLQPKRLAWLSALVSPLDQTRNDTFVTFRNKVIEESRFNSQTLVLQELLNTVFNTGSLTAIYIKNADEFTESTFIHNEAEGYPATYLFNEGSGPAIFLFNEDEFNQPYDFIVYVPTAIYNASLNQVIAEVEKYRFSGVNYDIQAY
jgi:hypothetical protein